MIGGAERSISGHRYHSYGLTFDVPFRCADLAVADADATVDVVVDEGVVDARLPSAVVSEPTFDAAPGSFLHRGESRSGRYLVYGGDRIIVQRHAATDEAMLAKQFSESVLPALLRQRGLLVLHANGAVVDDGAVLIAGDSGAGKSTTLAALLGRGCQMLSDDVSALRLDANDGIEVVPGPARMRLSPASPVSVGLERLGTRRSKAVLATERSMAITAVSLRAVYILGAGRVDAVTATALSGSDKLDALLGCISGPLLRDEHPTVFPLLSAVLKRVPLFALQRPEDRWTVDEVADCIVEAQQPCSDHPLVADGA